MKWMTGDEARAHFGISRTTWWRWRRRYTIRAKKRHLDGPVVYHVGDLQDASAAEYRRNPAHRLSR